MLFLHQYHSKNNAKTLCFFARKYADGLIFNGKYISIKLLEALRNTLPN